MLTQEAIDNINQYQKRGLFHPLTCGNDSRHSLLVANEDGLYCPDCEYKQQHVPGTVTDGSINKALDDMRLNSWYHA